jgi:hypothetical protein
VLLLRCCFNARYPTPIALDLDKTEESMLDNTKESVLAIDQYCIRTMDLVILHSDAKLYFN